MATTESEAKRKFLHTAAQFYSSTAPSTSAHLMLQHNPEIASNTNAPRKERHTSSASCKGCRTILVPGWTSRTSIISQGAPKKPISKTGPKKHHRRPAEKPEKVVRTDCLICHRYEDAPLPPAPGIKSWNKTLAAPLTIPTVRNDLDTTPPISKESSRPATANASSKQRAKARKKGGLQALLGNSKISASTSSGFGLDLSDLMKPG
ncbi:ribonuclease MRP protein subunit SNM1, partial [Lecanoromycetidae sp. Uapishka_2]